jgi:hypothetical protein
LYSVPCLYADAAGLFIYNNRTDHPWTVTTSIIKQIEGLTFPHESYQTLC